MTVTKVSVEIESTIPLAQYANVKPKIRIEAEMEPGEDREEVYETLFAEASDQITRQSKLAAAALKR